MSHREHGKSEELTVWGGDIYALSEVLVREWRVALPTMLIVAALIVATSWVVVPTYTAQAVVVPAREEGSNEIGALASGLGGLATLVGANVDSMSGNLDEIIAFLNSRELGMRFIRETGSRDSLLKRQSTYLPLPVRSVREEEADRKAYEILSQRVRKVAVDKRTGVVRISMAWPNAQESAEWANLYVQLADSELRKQTLARYEAKRAFLEQQLSTAQTVELREAIGRLLEAQLKFAVIGASRDDFSLRVLDAAVAPMRSERSSPNRLKFLAVGLLLGAAAALFLATHRQRQRNRAASLGTV